MTQEQKEAIQQGKKVILTAHQAAALRMFRALDEQAQNDLLELARLLLNAQQQREKELTELLLMAKRQRESEQAAEDTEKAPHISDALLTFQGA
jgi:hypothetical protein